MYALSTPRGTVKSTRAADTQMQLVALMTQVCVSVQIMVANIRCAEIMKDQLQNFTQDQAWAVLQQESSDKLVRDFGAHAGRLLDSCLKGWVLLPACLPALSVTKANVQIPAQVGSSGRNLLFCSLSQHAWGQLLTCGF